METMLIKIVMKSDLLNNKNPKSKKKRSVNVKQLQFEKNEDTNKEFQ